MRYEDISNCLITCVILSAKAVWCLAYVIKNKDSTEGLSWLTAVHMHTSISQNHRIIERPGIIQLKSSSPLLLKQTHLE